MELDPSDDALLEQAASAGVFRLQTILVPVDFSPFSSKALDYAAAFGRQFGATIVLVHVVEPMVYPENYMAVPTVNEDINGSLMKAAEEKLAAQRKGLASERIKVMTRLGRPYVEIADAAKELEADLIILGTHGHTGLKHVLLGSTAERVVRHAPCPVLTVRIPEHDFLVSQG
jgi:nucleotide-binding universal stress UspA family protein